MDKIDKILAKLGISEKKALKDLLLQIKGGYFQNLDVKKLKGKSNIFRVRKGKFRVIYQLSAERIKIIHLERRCDNTYNLK